jgi:hypothetical protein
VHVFKEAGFRVALVGTPSTALVRAINLSDQPPLLRPPKHGSSKPARRVCGVGRTEPIAQEPLLNARLADEAEHRDGPQQQQIDV